VAPVFRLRAPPSTCSWQAQRFADPVFHTQPPVTRASWSSTGGKIFVSRTSLPIPTPFLDITVLFPPPTSQGLLKACFPSSI